MTDEEVKDFVAINFSEYFKSTKEEQSLRKVAKSIYIFLTTPDQAERYLQSNSSDNCVHHYNVEILNLFDPQLQLLNTKSMTKNKLKELLSELKKFKVQTILVLDYNKRNECKMIQIIANDADIDEAFKSMRQSMMTKINNYDGKDYIFVDEVINHSFKIFEC